MGAAYAAGIVAVVLGAALVFFAFPKKDEEEELLAAYHAADATRTETSERPIGAPQPSTAD